MTATITPNTQTDAQSEPQEPLTAHDSRADQIGRADPLPEQQPASEDHGDDAAPPRPPQPPTQPGRGGRGEDRRPLPGWARMVIFGGALLLWALLTYIGAGIYTRGFGRLIDALEHPRG